MRSQITTKAVEDDEFRQSLLSDPKGVISEEFDIRIPDNITIVVHESDMSTIHLALPPNINKMSPEDLEAVSAGLCCCIP